MTPPLPESPSFTANFDSFFLYYLNLNLQDPAPFVGMTSVTCQISEGLCGRL